MATKVTDNTRFHSRKEGKTSCKVIPINSRLCFFSFEYSNENNININLTSKMSFMAMNLKYQMGFCAQFRNNPFVLSSLQKKVIDQLDVSQGCVRNAGCPCAGR